MIFSKIGIIFLLGFTILILASIIPAYLRGDVQHIQIVQNTTTTTKFTDSDGNVISESTKNETKKYVYDPKEYAAAEEIHRLVNQERLKFGTNPLDNDLALGNIAHLHSVDMKDRGYLSHQSPEGIGPTERAETSDYICRYQVGNVIHEGIGENIFHQSGSTITLWDSPESIAKSTVNSWMNSPGHKENLLNPDYRWEGIGVSIGNFDIYVTQDFC